MAPLVVSLCDLTGNAVRSWAEAGYECICYDVQHSIRSPRTERVGLGSISYRWGDVRSLTPDQIARDAGERRIVAVFAFPPCTHLSVSGARDFATKGLRLFIDALEVVEACRKLCEWFGALWMLENPVSRLSTAWRKPDHTFHPCDYGDPYTKRTCLWTGGGFVMPEKRPVEATEGSKMHLMAPSVERANLRSATPMGFARAVFAANARPTLHLEGVA